MLSILEDYTDLLGIAGQLIVALSIVYSGRLIARAQYMRTMQDAWNDLNKTALSDEENLRILSRMIDASYSSKSVAARKRHLSFMALNILQASVIGKSLALMDRSYTRENTHEILARLVKDDTIFELSQSRGYHPKFKRLCKRLRKLAE